MTYEELKALRKQLGISQTALAELLGMARISITKMEGGMRSIQPVTELAVKSLACPTCRLNATPRPRKEKSNPNLT